ncbi:MAG: hypothetical protein M1813_006419 [Trichoglossum hirsutum]|nr:MAG: hypothetical protein M1813_007430 [Trichoglossum hirsutum]KAI9859876.1 MAG: hypothetical protein M1813_006419 [Trichoglossum hirsutum]
MAGLAFDRFNVTIDYLNPNLWFSTTPPAINTMLATVTKTGETASLVLGTNYQIYAILQNSDMNSSPGDFTAVHFFLVQPTTLPHLYASDGIKVGTSATSGVSGTKNNNHLNFYVFRVPFQPTTTGHFCLITVWQQGINGGPMDKYVPNKYVDENGAAIPNVDVNRADRVIAQHNIDIAAPMRFAGNGITNISPINIYGLTDRSPASSLIIRAPNRVELGALREIVDPNSKAIQDVTSKSRVGIFESVPGPDNPVEEDDLHELPREMKIQGLEPGCSKKVYVGIRLPDESMKAEGVSAAFMLAEQVAGEGEVVGGVAVVAVSKELPVPGSDGDGHGGCS